MEPVQLKFFESEIERVVSQKLNQEASLHRDSSRDQASTAI